MSRKKFLLCATCLLGCVVFAPHAWTQQAGNVSDDTRSTNGTAGSNKNKPVSAPGSPGRQNNRGGNSASMGGAPGMMGAMMGAGGGGIQYAGPMRTRTVTRTVNEVVQEVVPEEELEQFHAFQAAIKALKDAKDDADKKKAGDTIREQLVKQFERDLVQREQELASVEERVKSLRQQLDKRKTSKDDIITLRLKTLINNAEGLGFPGEEDGTASSTNGGYQIIRNQPPGSFTYQGSFPGGGGAFGGGGFGGGGGTGIPVPATTPLGRE